MIKMLINFVVFFSLLNTPIYSLIVANIIEARLTVEDGDMREASVKEVKFDGEDVDLSKKTFMNRRILKKIYVAPGQYLLEWTTEKADAPWGQKETKKHRRMLAFELTDSIVYLNIRGENLTTY